MSDAAAARAVTRRLEHGPGAGAMARLLVLGLLADHPTSDEVRHDAALVVYELVANAVAHGLPDAEGVVELRCELVGEALVVRVRDAGSQGDVAPRPLEPDAVSGRGLVIVDALCSEWAVDRSDGTVVTAWVALS